MFRSLKLIRPLRATRGFGNSCHLQHDVSKLTSASKDEMSHFNALASSWWDVNGPQRILHKMNLLRVDYINLIMRTHEKLNATAESENDEIYIPSYSLDLLPPTIRDTIMQEQENRRDEIFDEKSLRALDVGCGGGILSESLARLSYVDSVKGIDLSSDVLEAAKLHRKLDPALDNIISYELTALEDLPRNEKYDLITAFEMLEHVQYPAQILTEIFNRLEKGGWLFLSTINRDFVSWFTTIFMGEHILRIVPVGTHTLEKYINEDEIRQWLKNSEFNENFKVADSRGCMYLPAYGWKFTQNAQCGNYFMAIQKLK